MTNEELRKIALSIKTSKVPVKMSKRDFVNAFGCEKRTSGNVSHINNFLKSNQLITRPNYEFGWIDEEMELAYKYIIDSLNFKLYSLEIERYKNLKNIKIDFESTYNYSAFIGLNGSGKSNILEAISAIFFSLYHIATLKDGYRSYQCPFKYKIGYVLGGNYYEISDGKLINGDKVTSIILPKNIIASYSGEDSRLWEKYYKLIFERYCSKLTAETQGFAPPFMFYISKYQWEIAMLVLLYSEDIDVKNFIKSLIGDKQCTISFEYKTGNFPKWEGTNIWAFIEKIKEKNPYSIQEFRDTVNEINFIDQASTLFYYLYRSSIGTENKLISKVKITFKDEGDLDGLSEGEKKLILTNTIIHILSTNDSLCLFDEPDSHIHLSRKSELIKLIDNDNRYSIITTHSSVLTQKMKFENLKFLRNGEIVSTHKLKLLNDLSGGEINYIEGAFIASSKNIVVVEGTYDIKYIKKAINALGKKESKYYKLEEISFVPQESAGNTESFFNDVVKDMYPCIEKILYVFDFDKPGRLASEKVLKFKESFSNLDYVFYQSDYTKISDKNSDPDFYIEDMFSEDCYKIIVDEIQVKTKYREFKEINQATHDRIKKHIEKNYSSSFNDDLFNGFKPFLDKLLMHFNK